MFLKNKSNRRFLISLCLCLLIGLFFLTAANAAVNPITGLKESVKGTGLENNSNLPVLIGNIIKGVLGSIGVLFLVLVIYAGVMWMIARGDEGKIGKARSIIITAITGFIIIMISYGITSFVVNLFKTTNSTYTPSPTDTFN